MTSKMNAKLRLVRCPRCREVLPELPDIPVYKCGGCGTILRAKNRKTESKVTESCHNETDENGKVEPDHTPEQKKIICLYQNSEGESSAEAMTNQTSEKYRDCSTKKPGDKGFSDDLPVSDLHSSHGKGDFSPELGEQMEQDKHIGDEGKCEFGDPRGEWHSARSSSDDFPSSMELTCHEMEHSSPELEPCLSLYKDTRTPDYCTKMDRTEHGDCKVEQDKGSNFHNEVSTTGYKHKESDLSPIVGPCEEECNNVNFPLPDYRSVENQCAENVDCCSGSSSFSVCVGDEHKKPETVLEAGKEVDEDIEDHMAERLKVKVTSDKNATGSVDAAESLPSQNILADNAIYLDNQHLVMSQNSIHGGFGHESSVDSFDRLALDSPSSEVGIKQTDFSKSSITRSYYAYDGSVSSSDGNEDRIHCQFSKPPRRKFKNSAFSNCNGLYRQDESRAKDLPNNKSEMRYQGILGSMAHDGLSSESEMQEESRKSSFIREERKHHDMNFRQKNLDYLLESRSCGHPGPSRIRVDKEENASRPPYIPRYFPGGLRNGRPSNYQHNVFQPYSGCFSPDIPSYTEPDKKELLRMVYELKEELGRMHISKSRYSTGFNGEGIHAPLCYNHLAPAEEICSDLHYSRYPGRCSQAAGLPQPHKNSRMAFSGDAADYRHQVDCSCSRGCPQDWHCSAQLPPLMICCNKVHPVAHSGHNCYKGSYSASSSPQHYKSSLFSLHGHETKSDDQRHRDTEMKRHVKEKHYSSKRHLMPVAGGIPIIACYHCSELLQLPADFLLYGRKFHRLRCNACGKLMRFLLESGTHLSRNVRDAIAPPPSLVDDCDYSSEQRDWASASHSSKCPQAEPISCSDDYGLSFDRSCSTEGAPSTTMRALKPRESNAKNRNSSSNSGGSFQPLEDRKMKSVVGESREKLKNTKENFGSEGPSSKVSKWGKSSTEIEELPPASGSPLHRLMGYLSPSEVIKP